MRRPPLFALAVLAVLAGACRDGTVQVAFRPPTGARYTYRVTVTADVVTRIGDRPARRTIDEDVFTAHHAVLSTGSTGSRVEVRLETPGEEARTFVVRLDRAGQLAEVQRIEGVPADILGGLGLSEIFPAAAAAPPERPLAPGDRWEIGGRLRGTGRLTTLGVIDGRNLATVESDYVLPVERVADDGGNRVRLDGSQHTRATSTHDLRDGAVHEVTAETTGRFRLDLLPPEGTSGPIIPGELEVRVRSTTTRLS